MTDTKWVIVGYVIGLGLLWGYAALLWLEARAAARKTHTVGEKS